MLRITRVVDNTTNVSLKVEGQIASDWTSVLEHECLSVLRDKRELILDFSGVAFIDAEGAKMLNRLRSPALPPERLQIINSSPLIEDLLEMARRWAGTMFIEAEKGFRRIKGYRQLPGLVNALNEAETMQQAEA